MMYFLGSVCVFLRVTLLKVIVLSRFLVYDRIFNDLIQTVGLYGSPGGTFLLITYHLLLTTYYLSLITYYLSLTTYHLLLITYHIIYKPS